MSNYGDDGNKRILRASVLNITVCVLFFLLAVLFVQIGSSYGMQPASATSETVATSSAETSSEPANTDEHAATEEPSATSEETSEPSDTASPTDAEDTENPESTDGGEAPETSESSEPSETDTSEKPEESAAESPVATESGSPDVSMTPAVVTPSPTLAGIEEPMVSGNVVVDVEEEKNIASDIPGATSAAVPDDDFGLIDPTPTLMGNVDDKGRVSSFFDAMVYVFIGCAVLTAGYGVFLVVRMVLDKKKGLPQGDAESKSKSNPKSKGM